MTGVLSIELIPGGLVLNDQTWTGELSSEAIQKALGAPSRLEAKLSNGRPWRNVSYYDDDGIWVLHDIETGRAVYIGISLIPNDSLFQTKSPFAGKLILNGKQLHAGMEERELPLKGTVNFVKGIGSTWKCAHDHGYVELNMKKVVWPDGKRTGAPVLVSVTHSFLRD